MKIMKGHVEAEAIGRWQVLLEVVGNRHAGKTGG
jgi:hypothetical protein